MTDADTAYKAAEQKIADARQSGADSLDLNGKKFRALDRLPPEIGTLDNLAVLGFDQTRVADITPLQGLANLKALSLVGTQVADIAPLQYLAKLRKLILRQTQVADITPLQGLANLKTLSLDGTQVADISPLQSLPNLEGLGLTGTQVADLRPIADLPKFGSGPPGGLSFADTAAARATPELTRLSKIKDDKQRTRETLAYLKTLPPWPEPLPWERAPSSAADTENPTPAPPEVRTAQSQIAFLLNHAAVSQASAKTTAAQIRFALRDVPATHGNQLSPVLETMADVATALERLAAAQLSPGTPDRERELTARIAQLEAQIETLTGQLSDETLTREAAEELLKAAERHAGENGFWSNYKSAAGKTAGAGTAALVGIAAPTTLVYFLGADHPLIQAFLTVTGRLPK